MLFVLASSHMVTTTAGADASARVIAAYERDRAFARALRHRANDMNATGACEEIIEKACASVAHARAVLKGAMDVVLSEESAGNNRGSGRTLTRYVGGANAYGSTRDGTRRESTSRTAMRDQFDDQNTRGKEEESVGERDARARAETEKQARELKFQQLKAWPAGTLAHDPHQIEGNIKALERKLEDDPESEYAPAWKRQLAAALSEKEKLINGAYASGNHAPSSSREGERTREDDHWFIEGREGSGDGYRHRQGRAEPQQRLTARQRYDYLASKIPDVSKSYFDCIGAVIKAESAAGLQDLMLYGAEALKTHKNLVSDDCKYELKVTIRSRYDAYHAEETLAPACEEDIKSKCARSDPGVGLIARCLFESKKDPASTFEPSCEMALEAVKIIPAHEEHPTDELTKHAEINTMELEKAPEEIKKLTHEEQHLVESHVENHAETQAEQDARDARIEEKFADKDEIVTIHDDAEKVSIQDSDEKVSIQDSDEKVSIQDRVEKVSIKDVRRPTTETSSRVTSASTSTEHEGAAARIRDVDARLQVADDVASRSSSQGRNFMLFLFFVGLAYGITRKGLRRRLLLSAKRLRMSHKGSRL